MGLALWHENILNEQREAFSAGTVQHSDWTEAKERINRNLSCGWGFLTLPRGILKMATVSLHALNCFNILKSSANSSLISSILYFSSTVRSTPIPNHSSGFYAAIAHDGKKVIQIANWNRNLYNFSYDLSQTNSNPSARLAAAVRKNNTGVHLNSLLCFPWEESKCGVNTLKESSMRNSFSLKPSVEKDWRTVFL